MILVNLMGSDPVLRANAKTRARNARYRSSETGKAKTKAAQRRWRDANIDSVRARDRAAKNVERPAKRDELNRRTKAWRDSRSPDEKERLRAYQVTYRDRNRSRIYAGQRAWSKRNPIKVREMSLRQKYGLTIAELEAMISRQGGRCAICLDELQGGRKQHIDHDHARPGTARGVLCSECNTAIGKLRDDPIVIERAATYVRNGGTA